MRIKGDHEQRPKNHSRQYRDRRPTGVKICRENAGASEGVAGVICRAVTMKLT